MIYKSLKTQISQLLKDSNKEFLKIQISYSGGMDSSCLLDILYRMKNQINIQIFISYVNYNTSSYSSIVQNYMQKSFPQKNTFIKSVKNCKNKNFESNARKIRYNFLEKIRKQENIDYTFTAHHFDDQFETILMKFIDGSDEITKQGVRKKYDKIYRPFLFIKKTEIKKYCSKHNVIYFKDPTNENIKFRRNKIRKILVPQIKNDTFLTKKINSIYHTSLKNIKYQKKEVIELINRLDVEKRFGHILLYLKTVDVEDKPTVFLKILFKEILNKFYKSNNLFKSESFWISLIKFLESSKVGSIFNLNNEINLSKDRTCIIIYKKAFNSIKIENRIKLQSENILINGKLTSQKKHSKQAKHNEFIISKKNFDEGVYARTWKNGDKVFLSKGSKKVSDLFIDFKLPRVKKKSYLILENNWGEIIWIPGIYKRSYPESIDNYKIVYKE